MAFTYDGDEEAFASPEQFGVAAKLGLIPINLVCDTQHQVDAVAAIIFTASVPQAGDTIILEDGKACEVRRVLHKIVDTQEDSVHFKALATNVYAITAQPPP